MKKLIFDPILQREGKKYLHFSYTTHITRTSRVWQDIWGPDLFSTKKVKTWPQDHYFSQKVLLVGNPTTTICLACDDNDGERLYFCDPRVGRNCFRMHVEQEH